MKNKKESINILIADDHPLIRHGLKDMLEAESDSFIIYEASNGEEAYAFIVQHSPEIAIVDFDMPKLSGLEIALRVVNQKFLTAIIILTMYDSEEIFYKALEGGVMGYVLKDSAMTEILECINCVRRGEKYVSPSLSNLLLKSSVFAKRSEEEKLGLTLLTTTERKVLSLIAQNKTTKDIAEILFISMRTVDRHRENICIKLKLSGHNTLLHFVLEHKSQLELLYY